MGYYSIGFSDFPDISCFTGVLGLFVCVCGSAGPPGGEDAWVVQSFIC